MAIIIMVKVTMVLRPRVDSSIFTTQPFTFTFIHSFKPLTHTTHEQHINLRPW